MMSSYSPLIPVFLRADSKIFAEALTEIGHIHKTALFTDYTDFLIRIFRASPAHAPCGNLLSSGSGFLLYFS